MLTADGRSVVVRPTAPTTATRSSPSMDGLSRGSRATCDSESPARGCALEEAAAIAAPPGPEGLGLIALAGADRAEAVAIGRYVRRPGEPQAELALAVADAWQGLGLGTGLLERLLDHARRDGLNALWALVLPANARMLEVFRHLGCQVEQEVAPGEVIVRLLTQIDEGLEEAAIDRFARSAAASMEPVMRPASIAVVGASRDPASVGGAVLGSLMARPSRVHVTPVNRSATTVAGRPAVPSLAAVEGPVDLAIVAVPAHGVPAVAREAARRGVRGLVVLSSGFSEAGSGRRGAGGGAAPRRPGRRAPPGRPQLPRPVERRGAAGFDATFAAASPPEGRIALASQSGGLGLAAFAHCARKGIGLSAFVEPGERGRRLGHRSPRVVGAGRADPGRAAVPRGIRRPAALRPPGSEGLPVDARRGPEGRPRAGGPPGRRLTHGRAGGGRAVGRRALRPGGDRARGDPRGAAGGGGADGGPGPAGRTPRGDRLERRGPRHPRGRRVRGPRARGARPVGDPRRRPRRGRAVRRGGVEPR